MGRCEGEKERNMCETSDVEVKHARRADSSKLCPWGLEGKGE